MKSRPEDRPKLIGLGIAIIGVLLYVVITVIPKVTGAQTAPPPTSAPPLTAAAATAPAADAQSGAPLPDDDAAVIPPPAAHDSFAPPVGTKTAEFPVAGGGAKAAPKPVPPAKPAPAAPDSLHAAAVSGPASAIVIAPPPLPPIELKGVILGEPPMAILSVNNEVVHRQEGELIAGTLKLTKIQDEGVTLQDGKKQTLLAVGHIYGAAVGQ